jgi:hypothetical protein
VVGTTGAEAYNAISITPSGVMPAVAHVKITNNKGSNSALRRAYVVNDVFGGFDGGDHLLTPDTPTFVFGDGSLHGLPLLNYMSLSADQVAGIVAAGGARILGVISSSDDFSMRAWLIQTNVGINSFGPWIGPVVTFVGSGIYDFGFMPAPPNIQTFDHWYLAFSASAVDAGTFTVGFLMICPGNHLLAIDLDSSLSMTWPDSTALEWVGEERYGVFQNWHGSVVGSGEILLRPGRANRLMTLVQGASGAVDSTLPLLLDVSYRQRRATL